MIKEKVKRSYRISKYIIYKETLVDSKEAFWSFLGAFIGIAAIGFIQSFYLETFRECFSNWVVWSNCCINLWSHSKSACST
jgi:CBS domain-containing membrane protein